MESSQRLDRADVERAGELLRSCCGSSRWVERMLARRPFDSQSALMAAARDEWFALERTDWLEAFSHHPKIGDVDSLRHKFAATRHLSEQEQHGVASASEEVLAALAQLNRDYEARFGYIFIVCATGRTADQMLALLRARLTNEPDVELRVAAEEQARITAIRLQGLSTDGRDL
jgi:2-oxo-4-hydroxy-4-carboxy-5-ureidoimidazoline decarboxylase